MKQPGFQRSDGAEPGWQDTGEADSRISIWLELVIFPPETCSTTT